MKKGRMSMFDNGLLLLVFLMVIQQLLVYIQAKSGSAFTVELFILGGAGLMGILFGYLSGFQVAIGYSMAFIGGMLAYLLIGRYDIRMAHYLWFLLIPFSSVSTAFLHSYRNQIYENEVFLASIEHDAMYVDPTTKLMSDHAMYDTVSKHVALSERYQTYTFSIMMIRIEFIDTIRLNMGQSGFQMLLNDIARILRQTLRIEDYKFLVRGEQFIAIFPMTAATNLGVIQERIANHVKELKIYDKNERPLEIVLKNGVLEFNEAVKEKFTDISKLLLALEKKTEEDIHAEYSK